MRSVFVICSNTARALVRRRFYFFSTIQKPKFQNCRYEIVGRDMCRINEFNLSLIGALIRRNISLMLRR